MKLFSFFLWHIVKVHLPVIKAPNETLKKLSLLDLSFFLAVWLPKVYAQLHVHSSAQRFKKIFIVFTAEEKILNK